MQKEACMPSMLRIIVLALSLVTLIVRVPPVAGQALDCEGFDSQIWAQSVYETDPVGYAALDPDGNGLACEELTSGAAPALWTRSEEHTSELQSRQYLVCRLLLEKKKENVPELIRFQHERRNDSPP